MGYSMGRRVGHATVTEGIVRIIRAKAAAGVPTSQMSDEYGLTLESVRRIIRRETWKWLDQAGVEVAPRQQLIGADASLRQVLEGLAIPASNQEIAASIDLRVGMKAMERPKMAISSALAEQVAKFMGGELPKGIEVLVQEPEVEDGPGDGPGYPPEGGAEGLVDGSVRGE